MLTFSEMLQTNGNWNNNYMIHSFTKIGLERGEYGTPFRGTSLIPHVNWVYNHWWTYTNILLLIRKVYTCIDVIDEDVSSGCIVSHSKWKNIWLMEWIGLIQFYKEMSLFKKAYGISLRQHRALHEQMQCRGSLCFCMLSPWCRKNLVCVIGP